ncbi:hypothetical protein FRC01_004833 [Tulasnella sp. 417]|nr:hypothetical protein FRC01_004833 [Tulasnella sp. 417]
MSAPPQIPLTAPVFEIPVPVDEFGQDGGKFYRCYDALAEEIDDDMVKGLKEQLDGMLIFAGLFAGVNSAFLALTLPLLSADTADDISALLAQNNAILIQMLTGNNSTVPTTSSLPSAGFSPSRDIFAINALFSLSMAFAIISSFLAVLGRQWLVYYRKRSGGGPERQRWEQLKRFLGAERWQLEPILDDVLPSLLQIGLIIFCVSLILYLRHLSFAISVIVGIPMYVGLAFFIWSAFCTVQDKFCPFQSPLAHVLIWSARTIPPAIRAIVKLEWRQSSTKFSLKRWVYASVQGREEESPKSLQVIAIQRAIRTSDDPETLLHAAANIFAITDVSQIVQLWSDISFQERFLEQLNHAYSRMLQLRGQNQVKIATASQRLFSAAAGHMILSPGIERSVPESFTKLINALRRTSILFPGSQAPNLYYWIHPTGALTILRLLHCSWLLEWSDSHINRLYSCLETSFVDPQPHHWRALPILCSIISHLCDSQVESGVEKAPPKSLINAFSWLTIYPKSAEEDVTETLRTTLDALVAPGALGNLDSNALLVGTLRCVNQCVSQDLYGAVFSVKRRFSLLEVCERIRQSPQLSGAAPQEIQNIRTGVAKAWSLECSRGVATWDIELFQSYMAMIKTIHPPESGHYERVDILRAFGPSIREVLSHPWRKWSSAADPLRFTLIDTFNEIVHEVNQARRMQGQNGPGFVQDMNNVDRPSQPSALKDF